METVQTIKDLENSAVEMTLTVPKETVAAEYAKAVTKYAKTLQIKGFRKGKAPIPVLEKKFGESLVEETMFGIIETTVEKALGEVQDDYKPLQYSTPKLVDEENLAMDKTAEFTFSVTYDIFPKFKLPKYTGFEIEVPVVKVTAKQVNEELAKLQDQNAMVIEKDGPAEQDSIVTVDYSELDSDGNIIEGTKREDYVFTIGTEYNVYKFDTDIIGMKAGDQKIIEKSFPEDYEIADYAGKNVKIDVTVKVVKQRDLPELDDDFAQDISEDYETLADLKKSTKSKIQEQVDAKLREFKVTNLYDKMLENLEISIPESMIAAEMENNWRNFLSQSRMQEEQMLQLLEMQGKGKTELLEEWRPQAEKSLKIQLMLDKITTKEEVSVSDEEVSENENLFEGIEDPRQREYYQLLWKEDRKTQKTVDILLEKNTFTKGEEKTFDEIMENNQQV